MQTTWVKSASHSCARRSACPKRYHLAPSQIVIFPYHFWGGQSPVVIKLDTLRPHLLLAHNDIQSRATNLRINVHSCSQLYPQEVDASITGAMAPQIQFWRVQDVQFAGRHRDKGKVWNPEHWAIGTLVHQAILGSGHCTLIMRKCCDKSKLLSRRQDLQVSAITTSTKKIYKVGHCQAH